MKPSSNSSKLIFEQNSSRTLSGHSIATNEIPWDCLRLFYARSSLLPALVSDIIGIGYVRRAIALLLLVTGYVLVNDKVQPKSDLLQCDWISKIAMTIPIKHEEKVRNSLLSNSLTPLTGT